MDDVLLHIFGSSDRPPLEASRVCKRWRDLAISHSSLWGNVRLELDSSHNFEKIQGECQDTKVQLERCGSSPLDITVSVWIDGEELSPEVEYVLDETICSVLARVHQCNSLTLSGELLLDPSCTGTPASPVGLPWLRSLSVEGTDWVHWLTDRQRSLNAPTLKKPSLEDVHLDEFCLGLPLDNVQDLSLTDYIGPLTSFF